MFTSLWLFGKRIEAVQPTTETAEVDVLTTEKMLQDAKKELTPAQLELVTTIENSVVRGSVKDQQINAFRQLSSLWIDSFHRPLIANFYRGQAAVLEKSEKNISFAALYFLEELMLSKEPMYIKWMGQQAKTLFEKGLEINPSNDSLKVGLGSCYLFGQVSDAPMQGVSMIKQVADKNPEDLFSRMMLGLGNIRNGQYDKAIEYFQYILARSPNELEAAFNLAETYERKGNKVEAIEWYRQVQEKIDLPEAKIEIENRIKSLK
jgi:tetratricopeptide (TPR) repeat protein